MRELTEEQANALSRMNAASLKVMSAGYKAGQGHEYAYAAAYRGLVRLGLAIKIKRKYNG